MGHKLALAIQVYNTHACRHLKQADTQRSPPTQDSLIGDLRVQREALSQNMMAGNRGRHLTSVSGLHRHVPTNTHIQHTQRCVELFHWGTEFKVWIKDCAWKLNSLMTWLWQLTTDSPWTPDLLWIALSDSTLCQLDNLCDLMVLKLSGWRKK